MAWMSEFVEELARVEIAKGFLLLIRRDEIKN